MGLFTSILTEIAGKSWGQVVQTFMKPVADYCFRNIRARAQRPLQELELEFYEKTKAVDFEYMKKMEELRRQSRIEQASLSGRHRLQEAQGRYKKPTADNETVWPLKGSLDHAVVPNGQSLKPTLFLTKPPSATALGGLYESMEGMISLFLTPYSSNGDYTSRFGAWKEGFDSDENIHAVCVMQQGEPALVLNPKMNNVGQVHFRFASWGVGQEELTPAFDNFASFNYDEFRGSVLRDLVISRQNSLLGRGESSEAMKNAFSLLEDDKSIIGNRTDEEALRILARRWRDVKPDPGALNDLRARMSAVIGGVLGIQTALRLDIYNLVERQVAPKLPLAFEGYLNSSSKLLGGGALDLPHEISSAYCGALRQLAYLGYGPSLFLTVARSLTGYRDTATLLLREGIGVWACAKGIGRITETPDDPDAAVRLVRDNANDDDAKFLKDVEETLKTLDCNEKLVKRARYSVGSDTPQRSSNARCAGERCVLTLAGVDVAFRWIPPGTFMMGSPTSEKNRRSDETQHTVVITKGFWLAETQTTQRLWKAVMGNNPSNHKGWLCFKDEELPVEYVSWNDCQDFIKKIQKYAPLGLKFCLPSEAHWEYACRAGSQTAYSWGDKWKSSKANNGSGTKPVGSYSYSNAWGLKDMHGNVCEWCQDWYGNYPIDTVTDPTGPENGSYRVNRGGGWNYDPRHCRSANRSWSTPTYRCNYLGFRLEAEVISSK